MRSIVAVLLVLAYCDARPNPEVMPMSALSPESYITDSTEASPGEFPWMLSQERYGSSGTWAYGCGGTLLKANYVLTTTACVDGIQPHHIRVVAGVHTRSQPENVVISNCLSYRMHEEFNTGPGTYPNDIAIIALITPIAENGGSIQYALLPPDNSDQFVGRSAVIIGWGYASNRSLSDVLMKATTGVVSTDRCNELLGGSAKVTDGHICMYDENKRVGACDGDKSSPAHVRYPDESSDRHVVVGLQSWFMKSMMTFYCMSTKPSVYTRVSFYLDWIATHTP